MPTPDLRGIIAATVLPQTEDHAIDYDALGNYLDWLVAQGVSGLAVNVDTGEGPHLSPDESIAVIRAAARTVGGRVPVIAGLGPGSTESRVAFARDLKAAGADALLVFPPSAFRGAPLPPELPVDYYSRIGEGADVPLVLFQLQDALGGVEYPIEVLVAISALPHVVAIKEATFSREKFAATVSALANLDVTVLTGNDNFIHESFVLGAEGALIGFGTLAVREQVEMYDAWVAGDRDRAAELGARVQRLADVVFAPPIRNYRARLKEALAMTGVIPSPAIRPPLMRIPEAEREMLREALAEFGLPRV
jgi:4-hydroxy-tetrahydrodipicolinate synthase